MKRNFLLLIVFLCAIVVKGQDFSDLFTEYKSYNTPSRPIYVAPMPNIIDNSVNIVGNSYSYSTPRVYCTDSQKQSGQVLMVDSSSSKDLIVDAEVLFKSYSDNTMSITITRLKLDGKWYPMDIDVIKLSSLLDSVTGNERRGLLQLMNNFTFLACAEDVFFLF